MRREIEGSAVIDRVLPHHAPALRGKGRALFGACEVRRKYARWAMYWAAAMAVPAVILTGSRGGMLAMGTALAVTVFLKTNLW